MSGHTRSRTGAVPAIAGIGVVAIALGALGIVWIAAQSVTDGPPASPTGTHLPIWLALRVGCVIVAAGAFLAIGRHESGAWRVAVRGASVVLAVSLLGDSIGALHLAGLAPDATAALGSVDSVERRLFRLASIAARAVPLLALLAAWEHSAFPPAPAPPSPSRVSELLLRFEPWLFAIGACTLASLLAAAAFINREIAWALPLGADTTLAGCAAAAIRARRRGDRRGLVGWLMVSVSMGVGLLMGTYSFGGPLPTPSALGPYQSLLRTLLRDAHVMTIAVGMVAIAASLVFGERGQSGHHHPRGRS